MQPVPGHGISTPYGARGPHWGCNRDSRGNGQHTGADFAAPLGTAIVAPIDGQIRHRSYGAAFGKHQFAISPDPGQPFAAGEVFFAHTRTRPADGAFVKAGSKLAEVGSEGNVTGPHLHLEYHPTTKGVWNCSAHADPQPVIDWQPKEEPVADGWLSLKDTAPDKFVTNKLHVLDIGGKTQFVAEKPGRSLLALYINVDLPPSGSVDRLSVARGGFRVGYRQVDKTEADGYDETGYVGPLAIPTHGDKYLLFSHTWPHTTYAAKPWEFFLEVYAFNADGTARTIPLTLQTREVKIVDTIDPAA